MNTDKDFLKRLKTGQERRLKVGIIDDNSDILRAQILKQVECLIDEYSIERIISFSNDKLRQYILLGYDILFWDASLSDGEIAVIDILEEMNKINSKFSDISRVMIGQDMIRYAQNSDYEIRILIEKAQRLPCIVYGNENGTKIDNMLNYMKRVASSKNIKLPIRLPKGICRKEIIDKIEPYIHLVSQNLGEQSRIGINLYQDFKDFEPTNEHERNILYAIRKMSNLFVYNQHCISQFYQVLNGYYYIDIERQQKAVQTDD